MTRPGSGPDPAAYRSFFVRCSGGHAPHPYQQRLAERLLARQHVRLWAPTGAGKTLAVIAPFLYQRKCLEAPLWDRLLYVLPLRALAESILGESKRVLGDLGMDESLASIQTGERPDDPFLSEGRIILTTYDQLLSGGLEGPYGLPDKLHNINAAAVAGALVVFDEYHLMEPQRAFLTAVAHVQHYQTLCQSVWMTATATSPLGDQLRDAVAAETEEVDEAELRHLPAVAQVERRLFLESAPLTAEAIIRRHRGRSIVIVNRVRRAQDLYATIKCLVAVHHPGVQVTLLHSLFTAADRTRIEKHVRKVFGKDGGAEQAILISTQVIEAGMDLTCGVLHTEIAEMNALVQRFGRCARFPGQTGKVYIYPLDGAGSRPWLPYDQAIVDATAQALAGLQGEAADPKILAEWIETVHGQADEQAVAEGWFRRQSEIKQRVYGTVVQRTPASIADLIRGDDTRTVRLVVARDPGGLNPRTLDGFSVRSWNIERLLDLGVQPIGWRWDPAEPTDAWKPIQTRTDVRRAFLVCLRPDVAAYDDQGLRLGMAGTWVSPPRPTRARHQRREMHCETWGHHAQAVGDGCAQRVRNTGTRALDGFSSTPWGLGESDLLAAASATGLLHDTGKLQRGWVTWAHSAQRALDPTYNPSVPLAHTDFDPDDPADRLRERQLNAALGRRPPHATAGAYFGIGFLGALLQDVPAERRGQVRAACAAAIVAHHGGWIADRQRQDLGIQPLVLEAIQVMEQATGVRGVKPSFADLAARTERLSLVQGLCGGAEVDDWWPWWPLAAFLVRTLRLADQRATSEWGGEE